MWLLMQSGLPGAAAGWGGRDLIRVGLRLIAAK
jgi:hypothetical protein